MADAWAREVVAKPAVAAELRAFREAAEARLGDDGVSEAIGRAKAGQGAPEGERRREGMAGVARALSAERLGQGAYDDRQRQVEQERLGLRQGPGMRM